jgi:hypothetical protein
MDFFLKLGLHHQCHHNHTITFTKQLLSLVIVTHFCNTFNNGECGTATGTITGSWITSTVSVTKPTSSISSLLNCSSSLFQILQEFRRHWKLQPFMIQTASPFTLPYHSTYEVNLVFNAYKSSTAKYSLVLQQNYLHHLLLQ